MKLFTLFSLLLTTVSAFAEYDGAAFLEKGRLVEGRVCYSECKPKKKFLGLIGDKKDGLDRNNCVSCIQKYPMLYTLKSEFVPKDEPIAVPELNDGKIGKGELCYDECKSKKELLGLAGKEKAGADRKSCVECLGKYPEVYKVDEKVAKSCIAIEDNLVCKDDDCFKACKPKKQFLGLIGKKSSGGDRDSCVACMKKDPAKYKLSDKLIGEEANCTLSSDKQYAYCHGDTYKLDNGVQIGERAPKEVPASSSE